MSDKAMYAQKTLSSTVHYLMNGRSHGQYGNWTLMCGLRIQGVTAIKYAPHGAKVCKRCVDASIREKLKS